MASFTEVRREWQGARRASRRWLLLATLVCVVAASLPRVAAAGLTAPQTATGLDVLAEARKLYDAQDYTGALPLLNQAVAKLETQAATDPAVVAVLVAALEMRARCKAFRQDWDGAKADYKSLLEHDPRYEMPASTSPRIKNTFLDVKKLTVSEVLVSLTPADAQVEIDGKPVAIGKDPVSMPLIVGSHTLTAKRIGFLPLSKPFQVVASTPNQPIAANMERVSAVVKVVTVPAGVEVVIDGSSKGTTGPGPAPEEFAEGLAKKNATTKDASAQLVLGEIAPGTHTVEFRKDCYVTVTGNLPVQEAKDYTLEPEVLKPSVATIRVEGDQAGLSVYLDGEMKGSTPLPIENVCQGSHTIDVRATWGRFIKRLDLKTGDNVSVKPYVRPAIAILAVTGLPQGLRGGPDLRQRLEQATAEAGSVMFYSPAVEAIRPVMQKAQLDEAWLAFDRNHNTISEAAGKVAADARMELSAQIANALGVQGVATIAQVPNGKTGQVYVSVLAAGSGDPDVIEVDLNDQASRIGMIAQLDEIPPRFLPSVGMLTIDVLDREGAVVARVDAGGSAAAAGIVPGDVIKRVDKQVVASGSAFSALLSARKVGQKLALEYVSRAGDVKSVELTVSTTPRVVPMTDQTVLFNKLLLDYRARMAEKLEPLEMSVLHLNAAMAMIALGNWAEAKKELDQVKLPPGPGVSSTTVQYLLGLCAEGIGQISQAESLWRMVAATPDALLTDEGPELKELAERKLAQLSKMQRR
jgi:hypothetical protein